MSNAVVSSTVSVAYSRRPRCPSHSRRPSASCSRLEVRPTDLEHDVAARRRRAQAPPMRPRRPAGTARRPATTSAARARTRAPATSRSTPACASFAGAGGLVDEIAGNGDVSSHARHPTKRGCRMQRMSETRTLLVEAARRHSLGGVAVAVVRKGEPPAFECLGLADRATNRAIDTDTVFRIASISKTMTAIGLMQLRDQGLFELDDPVNKFLAALHDRAAGRRRGRDVPASAHAHGGHRRGPASVRPRAPGGVGHGQAGHGGRRSRGDLPRHASARTPSRDRSGRTPTTGSRCSGS